MVPTSTGWKVKGVVRGTSRSDELLDVVVSRPNTVFVAGYEDGELGMAPVDPSGAATYGTVFKYWDDSTDTTIKPLTRGGAWFLGRDTPGSSEVIEAIELDPLAPLSRLFFAGRTTGSFGKPNAGQYDTLTGWLTPSGGVFTTYQFGNDRPQHPRRLAVDGSNVVIGGYNDYTVVSNYVQAWEDPYLLKLSRPTATTLEEPATGWTGPVFNTAITDTTEGLCVDKDDNSSIYISGNNSAGTERGMIVRKYAADGTFIKQVRPSGISLDMAMAIAKNPFSSVGGIIFAGSTYGNFGGQAGDQDVLVMALKQDMTEAWRYQFGSAGPDWVTDMTVDSAGNIYVVGETLDSFDPAVPNAGNFDLFVAKISADRTTRQVFQMGSWGDEHPTAIAVDPTNGKIYVVGYTTGDLELPRDPDAPGQAGTRDSFLLQLTPPAPPPPSDGDVGVGGN